MSGDPVLRRLGKSMNRIRAAIRSVKRKNAIKAYDILTGVEEDVGDILDEMEEDQKKRAVSTTRDRT